MDSMQALWLAVIQGLTEFLPISSSAHLILPSQVLGWPDQGLAFDVAVHVGSLAAVMLYFRKDIWTILNAWLGQFAGKGSNDDSQMGWYIIAATIPAAATGLIFNDLIETHLRSSLVIACTTIGFGLLLWYADVKGKQDGYQGILNWRSVMVVGFAQALALIPGTSRSGITMTAALLLGWSRELAARFSFLLSIPLILAAGSLKTKELIEADVVVPWDLIMLGTLASAITAYLCIYLFLRFIERLGFMPFVIYRLVLGAILLYLLYG